jgi:hypothetical protein
MRTPEGVTEAGPANILVDDSVRACGGGADRSSVGAAMVRGVEGGRSESHSRREA